MRALEKRLRERLKEAEKELLAVKADREKFRTKHSQMLKNAIRIHGNGKYWSMDDLIENFAKHLQNVEWFYW